MLAGSPNWCLPLVQLKLGFCDQINRPGRWWNTFGVHLRAEDYAIWRTRRSYLAKVSYQIDMGLFSWTVNDAVWGKGIWRDAIFNPLDRYGAVNIYSRKAKVGG